MECHKGLVHAAHLRPGEEFHISRFPEVILGLPDATRRSTLGVDTTGGEGSQRMRERR